MPDTLPVLVNREGGRAARAGAALQDQLRSAFAKTGAPAEIRLIAAAEMPAAIAAAAKSHRRIGVAGGDGTMSCAAQSLAGSDTELAILPLGTLNHLARDLAIPADLDAAAAIAMHGTATQIDLGSVNGHYFVNNASIGLYPLMVKHRDGVCHDSNWPKWLATVPACWHAMAHYPTQHLRVDTGSGEFALDTRLLFVGNNRYCIEGTQMGSRDAVHSGRLWAIAVADRSRMALLVSAVRALIGHAGTSGDFHDLGDLDHFTVTARSGTIEIAVDGEIVQLSLPLAFASKPAALRVVVPDPGGQP